MGLHDYVSCEYPLPDAKVQDDIFQTKDFYNLLENYVLTTDGKLIHESSRWGKVEVPYTGDFRFYTSRGSHPDNTFEWFEYIAEFKDGQLQSITRTNTANGYNA